MMYYLYGVIGDWRRISASNLSLSTRIQQLYDRGNVQGEWTGLQGSLKLPLPDGEHEGAEHELRLLSFKRPVDADELDYALQRHPDPEVGMRLQLESELTEADEICEYGNLFRFVYLGGPFYSQQLVKDEVLAYAKKHAIEHPGAAEQISDDQLGKYKARAIHSLSSPDPTKGYPVCVWPGHLLSLLEPKKDATLSKVIAKLNSLKTQGGEPKRRVPDDASLAQVLESLDDMASSLYEAWENSMGEDL